MQNVNVPVEVSARHCHLSKGDLEKLFGEGYELEKIKQLSQPSDFACMETIGMQVGYKRFEKVRIVGPLRSQTQIEISYTDAIDTGVTPPLKLSGDLKDSCGAILYGPAGELEIKEGLIVAKRHLHCSTKEAEDFKLKNGDVVSIKIESPRPLIFNDVAVRVKDGYKLSFQIDTDEGNAAGINKTSTGKIL